MATKDPAFCHAVLSQFAGHLSMIQQKGDPTEALLHMTEAIRIVNSRLGVPDLEICDGTIGAVACMVNNEVSYINTLLTGEGV
jgi:hypothetical protein